MADNSEAVEVQAPISFERPRPREDGIIAQLERHIKTLRRVAEEIERAVNTLKGL